MLPSIYWFACEQYVTKDEADNELKEVYRVVETFKDMVKIMQEDIQKLNQDLDGEGAVFHSLYFSLPLIIMYVCLLRLQCCLD